MRWLIWIFCLILCYPVSIYATQDLYTEQVILITKDRQVADTFCNVDAEYITTHSDVGVYSCAGYVKKFYMALFNANVYQINMYDGPPLVSMEGHTVSLKQVTSPIPGDIMQNTGRTHVGIVKHVAGTTVTLIEQNYKWNLSGNIYARINRKIAVDSAYFYRLVVDGKEVTIDNAGEYSPENCEQWKVSEPSGINVRAGAGTRFDKLGAFSYATTFNVYEKVSADGYTWGRIQYQGKTGYVALDFATYVTGSITDGGNQKPDDNEDLRPPVFEEADTQAPVISEVKIHSMNENGYKITCKVTDNSDIARVQFPTWSKKNGQDDLDNNWGNLPEYSGVRVGDTVTFHVRVKDHNNEKGKYYTHIYAYDTAGNIGSYAIDVIHAGFVDLGETVYCKFITEKGTYVTNDGANITARIRKTETKESSQQIWKCVKNADGSYQIVSLADGRAVYVKNASGNNGTNIIPYDVKENKGQKWYFYKEGSRYLLGAACTDGFMTLNGNSRKDGTNIKITTGASLSGKRIHLELLPSESKIMEVRAVQNQSLKLTWQSVPNADSYTIYKLDKKTGIYRVLATVRKGQGLSYVDSGCTAGYTYSYRIKTTCTLPDGTIVTSAYSLAKSATAVLDQTLIKKAIVNGNTVSLRWKKVTGANGYEIYRGTKKNGTYYKIKSVYPGSRQSFSNQDLKVGKQYFYKVRAYAKVNGKKIYGGYSEAIRVKT